MQDVATAIPKGSVEWEKAMRCLRQALRASVTTDWWKRVLVLAPRFKKGLQSTGPRTGSMYVGQPSLEFSAEMTCDAVVERVMELMQPLPTGYILLCLFIMCDRINNYQSVYCGDSAIVGSSP